MCVDTAAESYPGEQCGGLCRGGTWELVIRVAASVCESLHRQHGRVELLLGSKRFEAGESGLAFRQLMDALSTSEPDPSMTRASEPRAAMGGGAVIRISTPAGIAGGVSTSSSFGLHARGICVSNGDQSGVAAATGDWKRIHGTEQLDTHLPRLWKELCHVR